VKKKEYEKKDGLVFIVGRNDGKVGVGINNFLIKRLQCGG